MATFSLGLEAKEFNSTVSYAAGEVFQDCVECPLMVVLPSGKYLMGGTADAQPVHQVVLNYKFAVGQTEVTESQFRFFLQRTGYKMSASRESNSTSSKQPAVNLDWQAASAYARWLSRHTGKHYRLPSEAEWEYAARGGKSTRYWWGEAVTDGCGKEHLPAVFFPYGAQCNSAPMEPSLIDVGSLSANTFGLYDMMGNAGEWMQDCWSDDFKASPTDGSANADCGRYGSPSHVRRDISFGGNAAHRALSGFLDSSPEIGFRVVRELP